MSGRPSFVAIALCAREGGVSRWHIQLCCQSILSFGRELLVEVSPEARVQGEKGRGSADGSGESEGGFNDRKSSQSLL